MVGVLSQKIQRDELKPGDHIYSWRFSYIYAHHGIYVGDGNVIHFTPGAGQEIGTGTILDRIIFSSSPPNPSDSPCPSCGDRSKDAGVISSCLECFLSGGKLYVFQYGVSRSFFLAKARGGTCTLAHSDPAEEVLHRAKYLLQNGFGNYDISKKNCEDFAIYCKTGLLVVPVAGVGQSGQVASFIAVAEIFRRAVSSKVAGRFISPIGYMTTGFTSFAAVSCGKYCISRIVNDIGVRSDVKKIQVERLVAISWLYEPEVPTERLVANCGLYEPEVPTERLVANCGLYEPEVPTETPKK